MDTAYRLLVIMTAIATLMAVYYSVRTFRSIDARLTNIEMSGVGYLFKPAEKE